MHEIVPKNKESVTGGSIAYFLDYGTIHEMSILLQLQEITKSFGPRRLFSAATVSIAEGERIGFVGANGSGKTTLLRMILGKEQVEEGRVVIHPGTRLGYLEQQEVIPPEETVLQYLQRVSGKEAWECAKVAGGFALKNERLDAPFATLSGGYQMRVRLAGMLAREPNLLLLDEPTNYLDLQTILLLEEVLRHFRGAILLVSHDREFLKNVCTHTLEVAHEKLTLFAGDIEAYLAYKEERLEEERRYNKKVEAQRKHLQEFVDRFRAKASLATLAQSKMKQIARLKTIDIAHSIRTVRIQIPVAPQRKATAIACKELTIGYDAEHPIVRDISVEAQRGDHIAVLGENGQGKSTFLKTIAGELPALAGSFKWGHGLRVAYYAQHVPQMLPKQGSADAYLRYIAPQADNETLWRTAGNFLFSKDDLEKPISVLSGGERARLCLAGICLGRYDVLLLDEPTNHLDFDTVEALAEALEEYAGTVIFVSHSRTFVSQIATGIWDLKQGKLHRYPWPYEVYVYEAKTQETLPALLEDKDAEPFVGRTKAVVYQELQQEKRQLKRIEKEVDDLQAERRAILAWFAENAMLQDVGKAKRLKEIEETLTRQELVWVSLQEKIDALEEERRNTGDGDLDGN